MNEYNLTQTELANRLHIKPSQISEWLKEKANPGYDTLKNIATTLDISANYLLGIEDEFGKTVIAQHTISVADHLSSEEINLIENFRLLNPMSKKLVKQTVDTLRASSGQNELLKEKKD